MKLLLLPLVIGCGIASELHIQDAQGLIAFMKDIETEKKYENGTVFLDNDIEFNWELSQQFKPIGERYANNFMGTFDGQGHSINNLTIDPSVNYGGLFGYSLGLTIRNVVIGKSCTIYETNAYSENNYFLGSIIGFCEGRRGDCIIENCVNMMDITFDGDVDHTPGQFINMYIGGIAGGIYSYDYTTLVKDCVNYGAISRTFERQNEGLYMGGIVGGDNVISGKIGTIQGCANNGTVTFNGEPFYSYYNIGEIAGRDDLYKISKCTYIGVPSGASTKHIWGLIGVLLLILMM